MALPSGFAGLCLGPILAGVGSSAQHPRASLLVANTYGKGSRGPLGLYNFVGDLGKATFPAIVALLLTVVSWRPAVGLMALVGLALLALVPQGPSAAPAEAADARGAGGRGFLLLLAIGASDTAARMGYLLLLPFLIRAKGCGEPTIGLGLALLFAGGAAGKACCGWLGQHLGVVRTVIVTEAATALFMAATPLSPHGPTLALLPVLGVALNGTSSVLYGTVPELAREGEVGRAFALFYSGVFGAGGLAPIAYGTLADRSGRTVGFVAAALTAAAVIPMVLALRPSLHGGRAGPADR